MKWITLAIALIALFVLAKRSLWIALLSACAVIGFMLLKPVDFFHLAVRTVGDPSLQFLAISVGIIPIIGGVLQASGMLTGMVNNLDMRRDAYLMSAPAFLGLLPVPGGALLSAPLVFRAGDDISDRDYAVINVWFRHVLTFIYPLAALLPTTKMASTLQETPIDMFTAMLYLIPGFLLITVLGYVFLLRKVKGRLKIQGKREIVKVLVPIGIILTAPVVQFALSHVFPFMMTELFLLIGVSLSLILALIAGRLSKKDFLQSIRKMKPWNFYLLMLAIFLFLGTFKSAGIPDVIAGFDVSPAVLVVLIGALVGFITARTQLGMSILLPLYYAKFGEIGYIAFTLMYISIFMGYVISPLHPCILVTLEFFGTSLRRFLARIWLPGVIVLGLTFVAALLLL